MLGALADAISRRPRRLLVLVLLFAAVAGVVGGPVPGVLVDSTTSFEDPSSQVGDTVKKDLARAELYAFPILFVLSLLIFRGLVAALLPPLVGGVAIVGTFLVMRAVNTALPLSIFAVNLVTGLGLGLAIDYSLFILSRYREELARLGASPTALR